MKLSELKTGEKGVIVKVLGHGGFRKRIVEMGFIKGKVVEVLLNAPLKDPVKYKLMGYEVSLRHDEADLIEVLTMEEAKSMERTAQVKVDGNLATEADCPELSEQQLQEVAMRKRRTINVALVGNPNCGKTSLFNFASGAHERVGNYSGVTVDAKEGHATFEGYEFNIVDLPGTYSLSAYSPEELYVRRQIIDKTPDVIINVIDSSNLERNLYLTTQLIDMHLRMVCALNMFDEFERRGDRLDRDRLSLLLGVPMVPTSFRTGMGLDLLFHIVINMYEGVDFIDANGNINPEVAREIREWHKGTKANFGDHEEDFAAADSKPHHNVFRHQHINLGPVIENEIDRLQPLLKENDSLRSRYSTRYLSIKLLENDRETEHLIAGLDNGKAILAERDKGSAAIADELQEDSETAIMDAKYGFIHGALKESGYKEGTKNDTYRTTHIIDKIITNRVLGFPIFFVLMFLMFEVTFGVGQYPMDWIDAGVSWLGDLVNTHMADGPLKDMISGGIIDGVGAVIVFLPQILILYAFISFMEDSGYMARAAFIMDKLMHKMGLHGKSFIPLIMGFGCNVPAVMATRTIESRHSRLVTMLILPFMSCSARLPIYVMVTGIFFPQRWRSLVMISLYVVGIVMAVLMSRLFSKHLVGKEDTPFVMELPPYRFPTTKAIVRHTWSKGQQYLKKMGSIILTASIIVWALGYFPHNPQLTDAEQKEQSYIGQLGRAIEPIFEPQGFNWKLDVSLVAGVGAKEIVASTMGELYTGDTSVAEDDDQEAPAQEVHKYDKVRQEMTADGVTPVVAYSYLLFILLYFPCLATIAAIKNESGSWKWALFTAVYTSAVAWIVSALFYQIARLIV